MSLSLRGRGQAGEPVAGTSRVSLVHAVSWAGARSLGARMLRHRESIVLKMYSSLGNVTNKRTGLRVHTEEEPWRSVNVCFRLDTLSQRCYCKMYVNTQGAVRVLSSISEHRMSSYITARAGGVQTVPCRLLPPTCGLHRSHNVFNQSR